MKSNLGMNLRSELNVDLPNSGGNRGVQAEIMEWRNIARKDAADALALLQKAMAEQYNCNHLLPNFKPGNNVLIRLYNQYGYYLESVRKQKLALQYTGPFEIKRVVGCGMAFELDLPNELKNIHPVISAIYLKPYPTGDPYNQTTPPPEPVAGTTDNIYEVQDIIAHYCERS